MEKYFELTKKLVDAINDPFIGNYFEHESRFNKIKATIRKNYTADEALKYELTRVDERTAKVRVSNLFGNN